MGSYIATKTCVIPGIKACFKLLCIVHTKRKQKKQKKKDTKDLYTHIENTIKKSIHIHNNIPSEKKFLLTRRRSSKILLPPIIREDT